MVSKVWLLYERTAYSTKMAAGAATAATAEAVEGLDHWAAEGSEPRHPISCACCSGPNPPLLFPR